MKLMDNKKLNFIGNHNHTDRGSNLKMLDCINKIEPLIDRAIELGYKGLAITDHSSISNHIKAIKYIKKLKEKGNDFILCLGSEEYVIDNHIDIKENYVGGGVTKFWHLIFIAKDSIGYEQLRMIDSTAWDNSFMTGKMRRTPIDKKQIKDIIGDNKGHLLCSTACFTKGHSIITSIGEKNIEDMKSGDVVLTHTGEWKKVIYPTNRDYNGVGYDLNFSRNFESIKCTEEHKFLTINKKKELIWKKAHELKIGDSCLEVFHNLYKNIDIAQDNYLDFTEVLNKRDNSSSIYSLSSKNKLKINRKIKLTNNLMRTFGLWLADGHVCYNSANDRVGFTFNEKDFDKYYSFIEKGMKEFGKLTPNINRRLKNHRVDLSYNSVELACVFYDLFENGKSGTKHIPNQIKNINKDFNCELLYGYLLGDGYFRLRKIKEYFHGEICSASISYNLTKDLISLYNSIGFSPSVRIDKEHKDKKGVFHKESYYLYISCKDMTKHISKENILNHEDLIYFLNQYSYNKSHYTNIDGIYYLRKRIKDKKEIYINDKVYCLNVEDNHSFICNNTIVHNCLGSELAHYYLDYLNTNSEQSKDKCIEFIEWIINTFGKENVALEIQPSFQEEQIKYNQFLIKVSECYEIPIIITNDAHYLKKEDRMVHQAFITSRDAIDREVGDFYATTYLMDFEELWDYTKSYLSREQFEQIIENSYNFTKDVEFIDMEHTTIIPERDLSNEIFEVKHIFKDWYDKCEGINNFAHSKFIQDKFLLYMIEEGFLEKKQKFNNVNIERIDWELNEIWKVSEALNDRMSAYYNLVDYIVDLCWEIGFVGVSRGSITGYYTMYLIDMHQMNPITWNLPAYRHLNSSRISFPKQHWGSKVNLAKGCVV